MGGNSLKPLEAMSTPIELGKFMGSWYVLAHIPIFVEKNAFNAVENYKWEPAQSRFQVSRVPRIGSLNL